jgi:hypothetical protein
MQIHMHADAARNPAHMPPVQRIASRLVEALVLVAAVTESAHSINVKGVFPLANASNTLLHYWLVEHTLVHLQGVIS